jgi:colanic acid/amylovoran biosynthesis glycosyltransferase
MKLILVTANLPYGTDEAFIVPEIEQLMKDGHQVLIVPRSPKGLVIHGKDVLKHSKSEALCSSTVLKKAMRVASSAPARALRAIAPVLTSRTLGIAVKNASIVPKALWLADIAREWGAEHLHSHWAGTTASLTMFASTFSGIPWSFTAHRWDIVENNLLKQKIRHARVARFISEDGLRMATAIGIGTAHNARVLYMGVALPAEIELRIGEWPIVICPARLVDVKGHRFLLEAWRILRKRGLHGELWLAGDGPLRSQLESFARSFGLHHSIKFLGTLGHDELLRIYKEIPISAAALASTDLGRGVHEGIPVALMEAMAYGIPIVATSTGGTPELVKPGTGLLVPPADPQALADALQTLLQNRMLLRQIGDRGRKHVRETHDIARVTSELASLLAGQLATHPQNASAAA